MLTEMTDLAQRCMVDIARSDPLPPSYQPLRLGDVGNQDSSATGLRAGWWKGCAIPPRTIAVAALVIAMMCGHPAAWASPEVRNVQPVSSIVVRYQIGAPPALADGRPWGAQCVNRADRPLVQRGRWIGVRMRLLKLVTAVDPVRAERIARGMASCPYVEWAEPELIVQVPLPPT